MNWARIMHKKRAFIVTGIHSCIRMDIRNPLLDKLDQMGIVYTCFYDVEPDPKSEVRQGRCRADETASSRIPSSLMGGGSADGRGEDHVGDV